MLGKETVKYLAGIMDGEGSISIACSHRTRKSNKNPSYCVRISVAMCDKEIPWIFFQVFGGYFGQRNRKTFNHKASFDWVASSKSSIEILELLLPSLRCERKIKTAKLCLELQKHIADKSVKFKKLTKDELIYRNSLYVLSKELNKRGG